MFSLSVTNIIIIINVIASAKALNDSDFFRKFDFDPYLIAHKNQKYRIVSHAFLHGSWMHLFINMFVLWQFGNIVESSLASILGPKSIIYYLVLYFGGVVVSSLPALKKHANNPYYKAVGASGAVAAVLFSYVLMYPTNLLYLFGILPIPAVVLGVLYLWYERRMDQQESADRIAHDAHYWGAVFGFTVTIAYQPALIINFFSEILSVFS